MIFWICNFDIFLSKIRWKASQPNCWKNQCLSPNLGKVISKEILRVCMLTNAVFWLLPHGHCSWQATMCCHWSSFPVYPSELYTKYGSMWHLASQSIFTPYLSRNSITPLISNIIQHFQVLNYSYTHSWDLPSDHKSLNIDDRFNFSPLVTTIK